MFKSTSAAEKILNYFLYLLNLHVCINNKHQAIELEKLRNFKYRKQPELSSLQLTTTTSEKKISEQ